MIPINPYIAGNSVGGGETFVGRADALREVIYFSRYSCRTGSYDKREDLIY